MTDFKLNTTAALPPVLLTSCVYIADQNVNLKAPEERIKHTLESVEKWLDIAPNIQLIICDSSDFDFSALLREKFPKVIIECLCFKAPSELVALHGKGYGEGEIIKFALGHSTVLKKAKYFAKCTARLWVENFHSCVAEWNETFLCRGVFNNVFSLKPAVFDHIDTRFYLVSRDFYEKKLINIHHQVGGKNGKSIEDKFKDVVVENRIKGFIFRAPPIVGGVGGGTGKYYNISIGKKIKEALRYRLVALSPTWNDLINAHR